MVGKQAHQANSELAAEQQIRFCWLVNDILILGRTKVEAEEHATHLVIC
jgi:hypothetical protein